MSPRFASEAWHLMAAETLDAICRRELGRPPDPGFMGSYGYWQREQGWTAEQIVEAVRQGQEWQDRQRPSLQRIHVDGRTFRLEDGSIFRPVFLSAFTLPGDVAVARPTVEPFLNWAVATGFNGVRIMPCGAGWMGYGWREGLRGLPSTLAQLKARGLSGTVTALTNTREQSDLDKRAYLREIGAICLDAGNFTLVEAANEYRHETQDDDVQDLDRLEDLWAELPTELVTAVSAAWQQDEPLNDTWPIRAGSWLPVHLNRGEVVTSNGDVVRREKFNMARRLREIELVSALLGKPAFDQEHIGWDETREFNRRENDPRVFYLLGVLSRIFELGTCGHGQHGLRAILPGPVQQRCAEHFIRGTRVVPFINRFTFKNTGWHDSPVRSFRSDRALRVYSGVTDAGRGVTVVIERLGDPEIEWGDPWRPVGVLDELPELQVIEIATR